jgi:hypothetical protein
MAMETMMETESTCVDLSNGMEKLKLAFISVVVNQMPHRNAFINTMDFNIMFPLTCNLNLALEYYIAPCTFILYCT